MFQRSLAGRRPAGLLSTSKSLNPKPHSAGHVEQPAGAGHDPFGLAVGRFATLQLKRCVSTTSTSKIQQAAAQQRRKQQLQAGAADRAPPAQAALETHQARLERLDLWHSVEAIKRLGYRLAELDPIGLAGGEQLARLTWSARLVEQMRARTDIVPTRAFLDTKQPLMATNELLDAVWTIYAGQNCGLEFAHITNQIEVDWLTSQWERLNEMQHLDALEQHNLARLMLQSEAFDQFLEAKFPATKRYGCEGAEPMLVVLDETLRLCHLGAADLDELSRPIGRIDHVIVGMPHRGRLNLLACLLGLEPMAIFGKLRGEPELDLARAWMATGDVVSHLSLNERFVYGVDRQHIGLSRDSPDPINVSLLPNPSHLELVAPVTAGVARGRAHNLLHGYASSPKFVTFPPDTQAPPPAAPFSPESPDLNSPSERANYEHHANSILPIQIHGDAALAGQGIIQETLQMANLAHFSVGGSLHLVVNNQIGFTTGARAGRSSRHCTDVFKMIEAPVIHVNAQNIASVVRATRLALAYRQKFAKDVAINLICFRKHGHNELDEPAYTQPQMYARIRSRKSIPQTYCDEIGLAQDERQQIADDYRAKLLEAYNKSDRFKPDNDNYRNFRLPTDFHRDHVLRWRTGCPLELLREIALASVSVPAHFRLHPNLERVLVQERKRRFAATANAQEVGQIPVDWATAEMLAFGSLLKQNRSVRLAGQDVARGTFSTRHAILFDQVNGRAHCPLNESMERAHESHKAQLEVANTILSEEAALAYEYGYSAETCELSVWEAQFGDFHNTAQSVLDTLISAGEAKWLKQSPLTLLLPHGLDGAGSEHSSARIERFLQASSSSMDSVDTEARVNWSVCYPTLPHQYFHLLRRQVLRPFRKPLVVFAPKLIFRLPACQSELASFGPESTFEPVLDDPQVRDRRQVDTVVLCSGKAYFALAELKRRHQLDNVALVRVEELCPFPVQPIVSTLKQYPNARRHVWFQEEHKNQGAYCFVDKRLASMANIEMLYIGRAESGLPATGSSSLHKKETEQLERHFLALKRPAS